ncbi:hypothetical protein ACSQ76_09185 [Roseovarius sp. B08]|uniref:hypothetical protein n=1 Tax=Roseovarius sp. B08 TaxID=3449223 RepID=UPI003EDC1A64
MAHAYDTRFQGTALTDGDSEAEFAPSGPRRALIACAGAALCMSAGGLWLVPSEDAAMQLIKLLASVLLLLGGLIMFNGLNRDEAAPEVQIDPVKRQLRVYEYDAKGRSTLKACHDIDALQELSVHKRSLRARDAAGVLVLDMPLGSDEEAGAIRSVMPRTR